MEKLPQAEPACTHPRLSPHGADGIGAGFGFAQGMSVQIVILSAIATMVLFIWGWRYVLGQFMEGTPLASDGTSPLRRAWTVSLAAAWPCADPAGLPDPVADGRGLLQHLERDLADDPAGHPVLTRTLGRQFQQNRSAFIGIMVLAGLFSVGSMNIEGFSSGINIKSMLVFASFLGLACVGQTLVALLGGLDLSIPYVIGAANVGLLYLSGLAFLPGLPSSSSCCSASHRRHQRLLSLPAAGPGADRHARRRLRGGGRHADPHQHRHQLQRQRVRHRAGLAHQHRGHERPHFRPDFPPVIVIWIAAAVLLIVAMRNTVYGRNLYALGGNRTRPSRLTISEHAYWVVVYASAAVSLPPSPARCSRLERRRLHRCGQPVSVHDARRRGDRRHVAARRLGRLWLHGHRRAGAAGALVVPRRHRPQLSSASNSSSAS